MRRIFWDTMLFIYLLEGVPGLSDRAEQLLANSKERGDVLFTSYLALGEVLVGTAGSDHKRAEIEAALKEIGFSFLAFDARAVEPFRRLRTQKVRVADSIHLACAASAGMNLFLTGDKALLKLHIPGIHFILDFETPFS